MAKLNKRHDEMEETKRFAIFMFLLIVPLVTLSVLALISGHFGFTILEYLWILILICFRGWWVLGNLSKYLNVVR